MIPPYCFSCFSLLLRISIDQEWWCTSIIPDTLEIEVGGSRSEADSGKSMRLYLEKKAEGSGSSGRVLA
jgi:hypothetical protein